MAQGTSIQVRGIGELRAALVEADVETQALVATGLASAGETVLGEARSLGVANDDLAGSTVSGYQWRMSGKTIVKVGQSIRATTGQHGAYGAIQMREVLLPARARKQAEVEAKFEALLDVMAAHFN